MKFPERFWTETIPHLTDVAVAALLSALLRRPDALPPGTLYAAQSAWENTRYAWAAEQIAAELSVAAGITVDSATGLAVVWEVATAEMPRGPSAAKHWAQRLVATEASWAKGLADHLAAKMEQVTQAAFIEALKAAGWPKARVKPMRARPRAANFEPDLQRVKELEQQLRAEFEGLDDLGAKPSVADRRAYLQALAAGFDVEQVMDALRGRADKARRSRRWKDIDTAQVFLRLVWVCGSTRRLIEAEQVGASLRTDQGGIIVGEGGRRFAHGREIVE